MREKEAGGGSQGMGGEWRKEAGRRTGKRGGFGIYVLVDLCSEPSFCCSPAAYCGPRLP